MALLTKEEALKYLDDILRIKVSEIPDLSDQSTSASVKLSFLEKLVRAFLAQEPFQSIRLMSVDVDSRCRPTWEEVKHDLLLGRGGLCYWLGAFMYALLTALGFNASMTFSTYNVGFYSPDNHMIVLLHDLVTPGSLHLVDVGLGYYIPRAISLDFTEYSPEYTDSFMTYKFWRESENMMYLLKRGELISPGETITQAAENVQQKSQEVTTDGTLNSQIVLQDIQQSAEKVCITDNDPKVFDWIRLYFFNPLVAKKNLEAFFPCFDVCFSDVTKLSTHSSPRAMCWPNGRYLALVNGKLVQELEEGMLTKTTIVDTIFRPNPVYSIKDGSAPLNPPIGKASKEQHNGVNQKPVKENDDDDKIKDENEAEEITNTSTLNGSASASTIKGVNGTEKGHKGEHQETQINLDPLVAAYKQHFPRLPPQMVQAALKNWILTGTIFPVPKHLA